MTTDIDKTANTEHMDPDTSPQTVSGVRRVNNMPIIIVGGVALAFLLVMMVVAMGKSQPQSQGESAKQAAPTPAATTSMANEIVGQQTMAFIPPAPPEIPPQQVEPEPVTPPPSAVPVTIAETDLDLPPTPPGRQRLAPTQQLDNPANSEEANRIRMAKLQQLEEAIKSRTGVQIAAPRSSASTGLAMPQGRPGAPRSREQMAAELAAVRERIASIQQDDPTAAYQARLERIKALTGTGGAAATPTPMMIEASESATTSNKPGAGSDPYAQFAGGPGGDRWALNQAMEAPRSPYELRTGFVLPATLISGINSDLPGNIIAQVSQNVYDTATGNHLLIPQGSRLFGSYASEVAFGQERVLVAWQRVLFPDGKALDIGNMPGTDSAGYSGFKDRVNHHYLRLFGSALLMSAITAGVTYNQDQISSDSDNGTSASEAMSQALGQQLGSVAAQLIAKNMNIAPTIEIRPGYRFNVIVTKDMTFSKPYEAFDY